MTAPRNLAGDAVAALVVLLGEDPLALPEDLAELRAYLQRAALEVETQWERDAGHSRDYDASMRARRWARAIDATWSLARHEIDVALGRRRAGDA